MEDKYEKIALELTKLWVQQGGIESKSSILNAYHYFLYELRKEKNK